MDFNSQVLRLAAQSNEEVRQLFDQYFDELARLGIHTPKQGGLFSFERDIPPQYREKVNALSRTFQANLYNIVHHGIDAAYGICTSKHTDLFKTLFPEGLNLHSPRRKAMPSSRSPSHTTSPNRAISLLPTNGKPLA